MESGVYKIVNTVNGKVYVGSAVHVRKRWLEHRRTLRRQSHHSILLQRAWNLHGEDAFTFSALEPVADRALLVEREQFWIDALRASESQCGYNVLPRAFSHLGAKRSAASRAKMSKSRLGAGRGIPLSPGHRQKIAAALRGKKHSEAAKRKMSLSASARPRPPCSEETKRKIGLANSRRRPTTQGASSGE